ncbi:hypothetical protein ACLB2K_023708 [Fragaria x ananassa]
MVKGEERPTMKEVAKELEEMSATAKHPWGFNASFCGEESEYLLGSLNSDSYVVGVGDDCSSSGLTSGKAKAYDSMQNQVQLMPYGGGLLLVFFPCYCAHLASNWICLSYEVNKYVVNKYAIHTAGGTGSPRICDKEAEAAAEALPPQALPGCTDHCGNLTIPYPFVIEKDCYMSEDFSVRCNTSAEPPISNVGRCQGENYYVRTELWVVRRFTVSHTKNKFIAVGCDTYAIFRGYRADEEWLMSGCMSICDNSESVEQSCSGVGCCKTDIPIGLFNYTVRLDSYYNHTYVLDFNPCSYAFIVEEGNFTFSPNTSFQDLSNIEKLPMILNWEIGEVSCDEAQKKDDYACKANNIDECKVSNTCTNGKCKNSPGSNSCSSCDRGCNWGLLGSVRWNFMDLLHNEEQKAQETQRKVL